MPHTLPRRCAGGLLSLIVLAAPPPADAATTVFLNYTDSGLTAAQQTTITDGVRARFAFTADMFNVGNNLTFTTTRPANGDFTTVTFDNMRRNIGAWGETINRAAPIVYLRDRREGVFRDQFNTDATMTTSVINTAAHELGHVFAPGYGHNCNAPGQARTLTIGQRMFTARAGNGEAIGLMTDGRKVNADELAGSTHEFIDRERTLIAQHLRGQKRPAPRRDAPAPNPMGRNTDIQPIMGRRYNPELVSAQPGWSDPLPTTDADNTVDIGVMMSASSWELGYIGEDGLFVNVVNPGHAMPTLGFIPGERVDLAIRRVGFPETAGISMSAAGSVLLLSDPVSPGDAVTPLVGDPYYRSAVLRFVTGDMVDPLVDVNLSMHEPNIYDGFRVIPAPGAGGMLVIGIAFGSRRRP